MRLLLTIFVVGCASGGAGGAGGRAILLTERPTGGLVQQPVDVDGDQKADVYNYYRQRSKDGRVLVCKEVDLNLDGKIDVRAWFDDSGNLQREEMDGDFDDQVDWIDHYAGGQRVLSEIDTGYNGSMDLFKYYEHGKLRRKERDSEGDGRVDYWEFLDESGAVISFGRDLDGDGEMDAPEQ